MRRFALLGLAGLVLALLLPAAPASAGVATAGAVLLDPYDPVPEIQFRHYGGYDYDGCGYGCGGYYDGCGSCYRPVRCHRGCYRHVRCEDGCVRRARCDDDCDRQARCDDRCGDDDRDGRDAGGDFDAHPCTQGKCYDAEHYERRWRDGDRVGEEWYDRGRKEKVLEGSGRADDYYGKGGEDWHDDEGDGGPPPGPPPGPDPGPGHGH